MDRPVADRRRAIIVAGHRGDHDAVLGALDDDDAQVRAAAIGAVARCGLLTPDRLRLALDDHSATVRLRAVDVVAGVPGDEPPSLEPLLEDDDVMVAERAAWASGEREPAEHGIVAPLAALTTGHPHKLVRESAVAALGAIGRPEGLPAILVAMGDVATIRRRAVLALAPFDGPEVVAALEAALTDRDWQTRQAAADVLGVDDVVP